MGLIGKIRSVGRVAEPAPDASVEPLPAAAGLGGSVQVRHVDAGSCNGCEIEIGQAFSPVYDVEGSVALSVGTIEADLSSEVIEPA